MSASYKSNSIHNLPFSKLYNWKIFEYRLRKVKYLIMASKLKYIWKKCLESLKSFRNFSRPIPIWNWNITIQFLRLFVRLNSETNDLGSVYTIYPLKVLTWPFFTDTTLISTLAKSTIFHFDSSLDRLVHWHTSAEPWTKLIIWTDISLSSR